MPKYTQQQIEERYEKLPEVLKDAMFSPEIADRLFAVGKKYGLTLDKIGEMAEETGYITLGLLSPRDFTKTLQERLQVDASKATEIAKEINHQVFFPLREELKKAHQIEISTEDFERKPEPLIRKPEPTVIKPPSPSQISQSKTWEGKPPQPPRPAVTPPPPPPVTSRPPLEPQRSTFAPPSASKPTVIPTITARPMPATPTTPQRQQPPVPKPPVSEPKLAPPPTSPLASKIPPIDLRQQAKPSTPPLTPNTVDLRQIPTEVPRPEAPKPPSANPPVAEKKASDPYRESVE